MPCPYLGTVTMVFCRASPVKVYVPSDRVSGASRCEACWRECPFYRETAAETPRERRPGEDEPKKGVRAP